MPSKTFTIRISKQAPDVSSEQVAQWLEVTSLDKLAADPGAGERSLRLSLDADKVKAGAQAAGEAEAVFLRRLIASNIRVPEATTKSEPELEARPKAPVLKGSLKLREEQIHPLISVVDAVQSFMLRRMFRLPPDSDVLQAAAYSEIEKDQLASASVELLNRRAPKLLVENIDLFGFLSTFGSIELQKIEKLRVLTERRQAAKQAAERAAAAPQASSGITGGDPEPISGIAGSGQ
jgi:hypothetical protein